MGEFELLPGMGLWRSEDFGERRSRSENDVTARLEMGGGGGGVLIRGM